MDAETTSQPAAVRPIPSTLPTTKCPGRQGACGNVFAKGSGFVPDLPTAYEQKRGTRVTPDAPLLEGELYDLELCYACSHDKRFAECGIKMYPTSGTLAMMRRWSEVAWHKAQARERQRLERLERNFGNERSHMTKVFAEGGRPWHGTHKKRVRSKTPRVKKQVGALPGNKKKKGKGDPNGGKNKRRG